MKVALAQINPHVGDLAGNVDRCLAVIDKACQQHVDLIVLPEMAIPGYPPRDILFDSTFTEAVTQATLDLAAQAADGPPIIVGTVLSAERHQPNHPSLYNAAVLLQHGHMERVAAKQLLPAYDVFHEPRWFLAGAASKPFEFAGRKIGLLICEDMWDEGHDIHPAATLLAAGAEGLICISASPYRQGIQPQRLYHARRHGCSLLYVNLWGATDELIFDGRSFALNGRGEITSQLPGFNEAVQVVEWLDELDNDVELAEFCPRSDAELAPKGGEASSPSYWEGGRGRVDSQNLTTLPQKGEDVSPEIYQALVLGVREFAHKNRLKRAVIGLSGGIDSAVVALIAAEALGPDNVTTVAIPSRYSDPQSTASAQQLAETLGMRFEVVELEPLHAAAEALLADLLDSGTTAENIQARLRAMILMAFVNRQGGWLLNTSNKTELSLGYATLYGDMAGTLCPIADLTKLQVVALAEWINTRQPIIPDFIMSRPPSAELRPNQVDPFDYGEIAPPLETLVQTNRSNPALRRSEHKRWHMGVILKVSEKAFGTGRLIPITRR